MVFGEGSKPVGRDVFVVTIGIGLSFTKLAVGEVRLVAAEGKRSL